MELDDLKSTWKGKETKQQTPDIMELIHQRSKGPLASLKHAFRRQMIAIAVLMIAVTISNAGLIETVPGYVLFFTYIGFCLAVIAAFFIHYRRRNPNGVAVLIRSAGPSGWFHPPCQSQAPNARVAQAVMDKKERKPF